MVADPWVSVGVNARGPWGRCEAAGAAAAMSPGRALLLRLRQLDAYPKPLDDFRVKTFGGAAVTIVSGLIMSVLFLSELQYYLTKEVHPELFVDTTRGDKLRINLDVVFPRMACAFLSLDAMDVSGETQIDVEHTLFKKRLDARGQPVAAEEEKHEIGKLEEIPDPTALDPNRCESCYGANGTDLQCCNTCDDVREAYRRKGWAFKNPEVIEQCRREGFSNKVREQKDEGCRVYGHLEVNKVAGNFHFAPGKSFQQAHIHVHEFNPFGMDKFNLTHHIAHLSFGRDYPGIVNPLDGTKSVSHEGAAHEPVLGDQAREGGQRAGGRPGPPRRVRLLRAVAHDGALHREAEVVHPLPHRRVRHHRRRLHSGRADRLHDLPFGESHSEEDRPGQDDITQLARKLRSLYTVGILFKNILQVRARVFSKLAAQTKG
ncbi:endoplasmic reticulum-Golgi intermediate compartment protein 3-like isoform X2 [Lampetra fluviatilis]